jgi:hypothetical protein
MVISSRAGAARRPVARAGARPDDCASSVDFFLMIVFRFRIRYTFKITLLF